MPESKITFLAVAVVAAASLSAGCRSSSSTPSKPPAAVVSVDTWATVDGREITRDDVEKAYRRARDTSQSVSKEEETAAKLTVLDRLILQQILLEKARTLNVTVPDSDLDAAYADAKKNISDEAFQQELKQRGLTAADMREDLRREILTQKVVDQEIAPKIIVTDQEVTDFFNANRAQFNLAEEAYHIAQIVVTPVRDQQVTNTTGDDATTPEAAAAKVQMLMGRLKAGANFPELAAGYSEDPESAPRGGDLGFVPMSRLKQVPQQLRDAVINKAPGTVNVASAGGAYTLVLVVAHEPAGQRDLSTPGLRDRITETLKSQKEQMMRAAYVTVVRGDAKVDNLFARRLIASNSASPTLTPATPGRK